MTYAVAITEQAAREIEHSATWRARERSVEQAEQWYAGIRDAIVKAAEQPDRYPKAAGVERRVSVRAAGLLLCDPARGLGPTA